MVLKNLSLSDDKYTISLSTLIIKLFCKKEIKNIVIKPYMVVTKPHIFVYCKLILVRQKKNQDYPNGVVEFYVKIIPVYKSLLKPVFKQ